MHRLLVDSAMLQKEKAALGERAAKHLRVIRPKNGESIELFDGKGRSRIFKFNASDNALYADSALKDFTEDGKERRQIWLFACITKGSRWDWTIEKATELGVSKIIPVISDRTIIRIAPEERGIKRERWVRIAEDAARQSSAMFIPEICEAVDFDYSLKLVSETECFVGALTDPPCKPLLAKLNKMPQDSRKPISLFIGPEGDFTPQELAALLSIATSANFGKLILRAETAAIFALAIVAAYLDNKNFKEV